MRKIIASSIIAFSFLYGVGPIDTGIVDSKNIQSQEDSTLQTLEAKIDALNQELKEVVETIKNKSAAIAKYKKIAIANKKAIQRLIDQKAKCKNMETKYELDGKITPYEQQNIDKCFERYSNSSDSFNSVAAVVNEIANRVTKFMEELPIDKDNKDSIETALRALKSQKEVYTLTK